MNAEERFGSSSSTNGHALELERDESSGATPPEQQPEIRIGKAPVPAEIGGRATTIELFTMSLGEEAIYLAPLKTWSQLDIFKWRVQGKLPGTPLGLEIAADHVKIADQIVAINDSDGCQKLERAFNEWLALERQALETAKQKAQATAAPNPSPSAKEHPFRFHVELDKAGQRHIQCLDGKETVASVAVTVPGLNSLINQGLMRKPGAWKIGALRDWVELDGEVFHLKDGGDDDARLEQALNERYVPKADPGAAPDVLVFANPASPSGFDIEFPAVVSGLADNRKRHLDPQAMELLSDPRQSRVLRKGILVKLAPPNLVFKQQLSDGTERPLDQVPENTLLVTGADGQGKTIDLSQPVSHLGLGPTELTAIFNHPAINRRARLREQSLGE
ncbi:MAG TPA: hypothetical protein VG146_18010 [Verrucomicrobiae bacterium]|nr:hypothetical protein [Verrucomicrobiae bacterium]